MSTEILIEVFAGRCSGCGLCVQNCPTYALTIVGGVCEIQRSRCSLCGICTRVCSEQAIRRVSRADCRTTE